MDENRVLTFVVILRNKTGGHFQIDPNFVGSLYFMYSKLTLCMIRVSLDQKRLQLNCNPFWYKSKKEAKDQKSIQSSSKTETLKRDKNTRKHHTQKDQEASPIPAGEHKAAKNRQESMTDTKHK